MDVTSELNVSPPDTPWMSVVSAPYASETQRPMPDPNLMIKPINASAYDTDKAKMAHYLRNYEEWFAPLWKQPVHLLEIGVHKGGSMFLWRDYFEKGTIVGLDFHSVKLNDPTGRIHLY